MPAPACPTVKVVSPDSPGGHVVINESDLRDEHELWQDPNLPAAARPAHASQPRKPAAPAREPAPKKEVEVKDDGKKHAVHRGFGKWFVVQSGVDLSGPHKKDEALALAADA